MDAEEKLTALKKAYADIILNISKEAAARVMVSEKKVARYQNELKVSKEEGVRMLVRLKQMMDSKVSEAAATSLNQRNKIEELEAQLQEAEDIVKDLREELREVQSKLERVMNDNSRSENEPINFYPREIPIPVDTTPIYSYDPSTTAVASDVTAMPYLSLRNECQKCYNKVVCMCSSYIGNRDLPSIILRGKEQQNGLYRNGCTQRIRACERNLSTDEVKDKKNETELEQGKDVGKEPAKSLTELEKKPLDGIETSGFESFVLHKRKRTRRGRKTIVPPTEEQPICRLETDPAVEVGGMKNELKNEESIEEAVVPTRDEIGFEESPDRKMDVEKVGSPLQTNSPVKERVIKFTFQRKRKREALSNSKVNEITTETKKHKVDKSNGDHKPEPPPKSRSQMESSRDSRRLAQVARQLLSLSEKKWWR
ncbi:hypothetical protein ACJIZ3_009878 [Penstemon smallii]|uniref:Uncharacterized protein n=1 Tax=Penstemon smallii TaxID=265156 RepID=A0ABD3TDR6_9LAMI